MKTLILIVTSLILLSQVNAYSLWDNWHNVPTAWKYVNTNNYEYTGTSWARNKPTSPHPSGFFGNFSNMAYQYMYWNKVSTSQLVFCRPKYYLVSANLCAKNPIYWTGATDPSYCVPNTSGIPTMKAICDNTDPVNYPNPCCYNKNGAFEQSFNSVDPYSAPLM